MTGASDEQGVFGLCAPGAPASRPGASLGGSRQIAVEAVEGIKAGLTEAEQLGLLDLAGKPMTATQAEAERRGRGRPLGASNHSSRELRRFLGAVGADPLMQTVEWLRLSPEELARRLGCSIAQAFRPSGADARRLARSSMLVLRRWMTTARRFRSWCSTWAGNPMRVRARAMARCDGARWPDH